MQRPPDLVPSSQPRPGRYGPPPTAIDPSSQTPQIQVARNYSPATFPSTSKVYATPHDECLFIQRLSTDVRTQIYSYLLLNPILSTLAAVSPNTDFGVQQKYELHPAILGTCKELYEEASGVLYGLNTFYMVAMKSSRMFRFTLADFMGGSALTRYWRENPDVFKLAPESALYLCKVRQWRVEISCYGLPAQADIELPVISIRNPIEYGVTRHLPIDPRSGIPAPSGRRRYRNHYLLRLASQEARDHIRDDMVSYLRPSLEYSIVPFCHLMSLCAEPPHALEIIIRPKAAGEVPLRSEYLGVVPTEIEQLRLIRPLEMLRGVQDLKFTHSESADQDDVPTEVSNQQLAWESALNLLATTKKEAWQVECPSKLYTNLLSYAQTFERYEPFKQRMAANWLYQNSYMSTPNPYKAKSPNPIQFSNPFGPHNDNYKSHPVNQHLSSAAAAVRRHDVKALKEARKNLLEYLEPQYKRIIRKSKKFREFVDLQCKRYGIWDSVAKLEHEMDRYAEAMESITNPMDRQTLIGDQNMRLGRRIRSIDFAEALVVLEEYAESFVRDIPHETRKQIARIRFEYQGHYDIMEREVAIRKLQKMVVDISGDLDYAILRFKEIYKIAANDMQKQYLEIRKARNGLFRDDVMGEVWECPIDLRMETGMEDQEIDWTAPRDDERGLGGLISGTKSKRNYSGGI
ncbi:hypothetical protein SBOR_5354 [Sclerotinia borealis F-4128]|uniref:Uncharacterized protein n=1 Tax=Sclerotinia borealis (strain F-4128) TaxID=1432307 RepID=W9CEK4_SCLBF|nr:hypothetical protein SBOR_5354 [Sclerotinia borealis F-4128]